MQSAVNSQFPIWLRLRNALQRRFGDQASPLTSDTVANWPPERTRVLTGSERLVFAALDGARQAVHPQGFVLAHVPLLRMVHVPRRHSYKDWLARTSHLVADFVVCDASTAPLTVVLMESQREGGSHASRRQERLMRVLKAAGIRVLIWRKGWQPSPKGLRNSLFSAEELAQIPSR
jgi:Protein of unknown function (DUF2726)